MKVAERVLDVTSTLDGEKVGMTIDEGALAHIMSVLTDLYSDPELAVIREYSTNAFDAHVESGLIGNNPKHTATLNNIDRLEKELGIGASDFNSRPIEVTTPSALAPFFTVRDYGAGLDVNDIRDIYSKYGASTKRESNDVVGMLGLGCKSALTYTDQFTVTGWKDGICTQVAVSRDEDGSGSMTIVAEFKSDEPSGVEISVPAKRYHSFEEKASDFFRFWKPGTVLVNGKQPKQISGMWVTDDLLMTEDAEQDVVVMGNVAYPLPENNYNRYALVAFVGIGEVNFTPSREALQMTKQTKDTLAAIKERFKVERDNAVQRNVNAATSHVEALKVYLSASRMNYKGTPTYNGQEIPTQFKIEKTHQVKNADGTVRTYTTDESFITVKSRKYYGDKGWYREPKLYTGAFAKAAWIVGYDISADFSPTKRKKLDQWVAEKNIDISKVETFVFVPEIPKKFKQWIDPATIYSWEEIKAQKIVRPAGQTMRNGRVTGTYEGWVNGTYERNIKAEEINTNAPLYYVNKTASYNWEKYKVVFANTGEDHTYVTLAGNRVAKFKRDFPMALEASAAATKIVADWKSALTQEQIDLLVIGEDYHRKNDLYLLSKLDAEKIDDPEVKDAITMASIKLDEKLKRQYQAYRVNLTSKWVSPLAKYTLLQHARNYATIKVEDELYIYINAVYQSRSAK